MNQQPIDIIALCVFIAGTIFAPDVAAVIGPYVAIIVASAIGASFAVGKRESRGRVSAVFFFLRVMLLACFISGMGAAMVNKVWPTTHPGAALIPVALLIGFIGDDWPVLLGKVKRLIFTLIDTWRAPQ